MADELSAEPGTTPSLFLPSRKMASLHQELLCTEQGTALPGLGTHPAALEHPRLVGDPGPGALCSLGADQQQGQSSWENHILLQSRLPPWASLNCLKRTVEQRNGALKGNGNHSKTRIFKAPQH